MTVSGQRVFGLSLLFVAVSAAPIAGSTAAILVALAGSAGATDGVIPTKAAPIPYADAFDWTGFYVGGHVAYGLGRGTSTLSDPNPFSAGDSFGSLYGGVQAGYNYVFPSRLLLGAEADITFPNFQTYADGLIFTGGTAQGTTVTDQIDYIATLRGRFGYAFDRWLIYGTGGFAWSQARFGETNAAGDEDLILLTRTGWTLGLGAEVAIAPDWTVRIEYLYDRFGSVAGVFPSGTGYQSVFDINTLRFGLNYKLGVSDADMTARTSDLWPIARDNWNIHGQFTFIEQGYPAFHSPYEGANSLSGASQAKNTESATAFVGYRPWDGTEIYINPELTQGAGLSTTHGIAAFPSFEAQKANFPMPRIDMARLYVQQTFGLGGEQETIEDGPNQVAGTKDISRITVIAGRFAVTDFFDNNTYAHDGRTQFFNWNIDCCGSYDWTMDQISYTWGAMAELNQKFWAVRAGYFLVPVVSNSDDFDMNFPDGEYIGELELRYSLFSQPGKLRLMAWANRANMGSYTAALAEPITTPNYPDITLVRQVRTNYGFDANLEQAITADLGVFSRATWSPGLDEIIAWTDCDQSVSAGAVLKGTSWGRPNDTIGIGGVLEGLSPEARAYFAAGGLGILIGDGALNYRPEKVLESYYSYSLNKWASLTFDYQFVGDPGYNADRGPVHIFSGRVHAQF